MPGVFAGAVLGALVGQEVALAVLEDQGVVLEVGQGVLEALVDILGGLEVQETAQGAAYAFSR